MREFLNMGGYGAFVWPAYAAVFVLMAALVANSLRRWRNARQLLSVVQQSAPHRAGQEVRDDT